MAKPDTRERLLRITADELARGGYERMSLRRVAARAGIGPATVFHHFPGGKQGLYQATLQHLVDEVTALARMSYGEEEGRSAEEVIVQRAESFWDFLVEKSELAAMLLRESFEDDPREGDLLQEHAGAVIDFAVAFIEEGQRRGELGAFDPHRFLLWATLHILGYHGAPRIHRELLGADEGEAARRSRSDFLAMLRAYLRGEMPGTP